MLQEDARLQQLVRAYGAANWSVIAQVLANTAPDSVQASVTHVALSLCSRSIAVLPEPARAAG